LFDARADTNKGYKRPILMVLNGLAKFERDMIRAYTGVGAARIKPNSVKMRAVAEDRPIGGLKNQYPGGHMTLR
jgi:hypothetical protein